MKDNKGKSCHGCEHLMIYFDRDGRYTTAECMAGEWYGTLYQPSPEDLDREDAKHAGCKFFEERRD